MKVEDFNKINKEYQEMISFVKENTTYKLGMGSPAGFCFVSAKEMTENLINYPDSYGVSCSVYDKDGQIVDIDKEKEKILDSFNSNCTLEEKSNKENFTQM